MSNFFRSMGRASRPKKSPTLPNAASPFSDAQHAYLAQNHHAAALPAGVPKPLYLCQPFVRSALIKGNFKTIVVLPKYVEEKEWVAVNLFDFFNNLNQFYGVLTEFCTVQNNPTMSAGVGLDYTWIDQNRKQVKLPAPQYIDYVMTWVGGLLSDEATFPTKAAREFPATFPTTAKHIYKQLLRVFAHVYHAQYPYLVHLCCEGHFNSLFAHFVAFGTEFGLFSFREFKGPQHVGAAAAAAAAQQQQASSQVQQGHAGGGSNGTAASGTASDAALSSSSAAASQAGGGGGGGGGGAPYPGVCDLIEKWVEMGILTDECVRC